MDVPIIKYLRPARLKIRRHNLVYAILLQSDENKSTRRKKPI